MVTALQYGQGIPATLFRMFVNPRHFDLQALGEGFGRQNVRGLSEQAVVYRPAKRDAAGRTEQQIRAMDLPPASGSRPLYPGSKEQIALGGNAPQPPVISMVDEEYARKIGEAHSAYPRAFYKKAFRRERDSSGKIIPGGEVFLLKTADVINPNYPVPLNIAERASIKGIVAADLDKATTDVLIAHRELDNMPSPFEAASIRAQEALARASQTAKNNAEAANARLDAKMKQVKLVYAVDANGQMNLLPLTAANQAGMKIYQEAPADAYQNEKKSAIEIGSVQSGISEYRAAANAATLRSDPDQDKATGALLSNNKLLGELADTIPLGARMNDVATGLQNAAHWNELDPEHQRLVASYFTAKIGAMNMQKLQGGSIGRNQEVIHAEFAAVPSPMQAGSPSFNEQVDQFQKRLNVASQGSVRVPGVRTPQEIRADIEARQAQELQNQRRANEVFQQNRIGGTNSRPTMAPNDVPGTPLPYRPPISTGTAGAG